MSVPPGFPPEFPSPPGHRPLAEPPPPRPQPMPFVAPGAVTVVAGLSPTDAASERLLERRVVYVGGEIDDALADRVVAQLVLLGSGDPRRDVTLLVHSPGGSATAGAAILDTMRGIAPDVATCAVGLAASVGQVLVSAGAAGKRRALPHARLLLTHPSARVGGASELTLRSGVFTALKHDLVEVVAGASGQDVEQVAADADAGRWFTAAEAVDYGLVDEIGTGW